MEEEVGADGWCEGLPVGGASLFFLVCLLIALFIHHFNSLHVLPTAIFTLDALKTEVKPGNRTKPKHVYNLAECVVREITANKPNAFCVHENSKNDMMVFAAKDRRQLDQWLRLLTNGLQAETFTHHTTITPEDDESEPEGDPEDENDQALNTESMSKRDLAMLYFEEYDISNEAVSTFIGEQLW